jgi:hypothetical protein
VGVILEHVMSREGYVGGVVFNLPLRQQHVSATWCN